MRIVPTAAAAAAARAKGEAALLSGASDVQAAHALRALEAHPVLRLESAEGVFGGWTTTRAASEFETMVTHSSLLTGSWCCSSWCAQLVVPRS